MWWMEYWIGEGILVRGGRCWRKLQSYVGMAIVWEKVGWVEDDAELVVRGRLKIVKRKFGEMRKKKDFL